MEDVAAVLAASPGFFCAGGCSGSGVKAEVNGEEGPVGEALGRLLRSTNTVLCFWTRPARTNCVGGVELPFREMWNCRGCCFTGREVCAAGFCKADCMILFAEESCVG